MANVTIFCPKTRSNVRVWVSEAQPGDSADAYDAVTCPGCASDTQTRTLDLVFGQKIVTLAIE